VKYTVRSGERTLEVELVERLGKLLVTVDGQPMDVHYEEADQLGQVLLLYKGRSHAISIEGDGHRVDVTLAGHHYALTLEDEREHAAHLAETEARRGGGTVEAIMPGVVVEVLVTEGEQVAQGQPLLVLEAMKMQNEIPAPANARVERLHVEPGQAVKAGEKLVTLVGTEE